VSYILESCHVQNFDVLMNAVVGAHMKGYRNKSQLELHTRIDSMVTHFRLHHMNFIQP
jgi:hypothetical protein